MNTWNQKLLEYRINRNFNPSEWVLNKANVFNEYLKKNNLYGAVLSVSGGIDSAVTLALLSYTLSLPNSNLKKIWAINQPIHSSNWALERANELCKHFDIELKVIDQTKYYDLITDLVYKETGVVNNNFSGGQMKSYMRTPINYYCAQLMTQIGYPAVVMGTGNKDEDGYLAYFCKAGDGVVDIQLISDLHKSEVYKVGNYLKVPDSILNAVPSADLWDGQEDEKELGFTYDFIEFYTGYYLKMEREAKLEFLKTLDNSSYKEFIDFEEKCKTIHNKNQHKLIGIVNL